MPHVKGKPQTPAEWRASKKNSTKSPWRTTPALNSKRQRKCWDHFQKLAAEGDTARKPRPELDEVTDD